MTKQPHNKHKEKEKLTPPPESEDEIQPVENIISVDSGEKKEEAVIAGPEEETVTVPLKDYAAQMEEIDQLKTKVNDFSEGWQRERADFTNYRNRVLRDQEQVKQNITADVVMKYLVVNDDIELALKNAPNNEEVKGWVEGIQLIYQKLHNILESEGVQRIPAENEYFDPNRHEAIAIEENPLFESGRVIEVVQQGYTISDRVIRPARVRIAK